MMVFRITVKNHPLPLHSAENVVGTILKFYADSNRMFF